MRKYPIELGEYYHVYNRGVRKQTIFHDKRDYTRLLFLLLYLQSPELFRNVSYNVSKFLVFDNFRVSESKQESIVSNREVMLSCFILMPNHFHLLLKEHKKGGICRYMQRIQTAYTKYYNTKKEVSGHLFQGPYKYVHVENNEQLIYLSAYIHRNSRDLIGYKNKESKYKWSSYKDYIGENRWGKLLVKDIITNQFTSNEDYDQWVKTSKAKEALIL
jgi:putative transposase